MIMKIHHNDEMRYTGDPNVDELMDRKRVDKNKKRKEYNKRSTRRKK